MFEVLALLVILRRRWQGIGERQLSRTLAKTLAASLVMAAVIALIDMIWLALAPGSGLSFTIMRLGLEGVIGLLVFLLVAILLKMKEISELWAIIKPGPGQLEKGKPTPPPRPLPAISMAGIRGIREGELWTRAGRKVFCVGGSIVARVSTVVPRKSCRKLFCDLWLKWASHRLARTTIRKYCEFFQNGIIRNT